jgi:hypothetical protein
MIGGSYKMIDGVRVLVRRTGWTPPVKESPKGEKKKRGRKSAAGSEPQTKVNQS